MATQPSFDDRSQEWTIPADLIDCEVGGEIVQLPVADLVCTIGHDENENEWNSWIEFRRPGEDAQVHRSARTYLKKALGPLGAALAAFS